jgi:hypothetical protein
MDLPFMTKPFAYFRGTRQIPGAGINMGWQLFTKPVLPEKEPHMHDADEYLVFLGSDPADWFSSFDAEIDLFLGEELEQYVIDKPTIVNIPPKLSHCPLNFRIMNKSPCFYHPPPDSSFHQDHTEQAIYLPMIGGRWPSNHW